MGNADKKPLISVIVPVYNTECFLRKCVDSIIAQTYDHLEIILIDDGSTDQCPAICDEYAEKDSRVKVIHKSNGGISSARNAGIEIFTGEYLCYVDSDDTIEKNFIERLGDNEQEDIIVSGTRTFTVSAEQLSESHPEEKVYLGNDAIKAAYLNNEIEKFLVGPVAKLYNRRLVDNIRFDENMTVAEDIVYNPDVLCHAQTVRTICYAGYNVTSHPMSTTHLIHTRYSKLLEHNADRTIDKNVAAAKQRWGVWRPEPPHQSGGGTAIRYYLEITNIVRPGSPNSFREACKAIRNIHKDKVFVSRIRKAKFGALSNQQKFSKLCVHIRISWMVYLLVKTIVKLGK